MRTDSPAAPAAIALVAIAMLAGGCGDEDVTSTATSGTGAAGAAGPVGSTTTPTESERQGERGGGPAASSDDAAEGPSAGSEGGAASADAGAPTVQAAIEAVLTDAGSPEQACGAYVTERFLQRAYGGRANCLAARRPNALARSVEITRSFVNEQGAHAVAIPSGGPYDGAKVEIEVVPANGFGGAPYKLDSLKANIPAGP